MAQEIIIPVICENLLCRNVNRVVNTVSGITIEDMDLFFDSYDGSDAHDYCAGCGELGVAEDAIFL